jgi:nucleotide-binding universal stress UspA family protein
VEPPFYPSAYGIDSTAFPTQDVVDRVEKQLGDMARDEIGYEHVMIKATVGHPPSEILSYVEENEVDLVVIATHGRTGLERALLGSVTERVLRRLPVPTFVVKPTRKSLLPEPKAAAGAK